MRGVQQQPRLDDLPPPKGFRHSAFPTPQLSQRDGVERYVGSCGRHVPLHILAEMNKLEHSRLQLLLLQRYEWLQGVVRLRGTRERNIGASNTCTALRSQQLLHLDQPFAAVRA
jgi:hypothetical protein